MKSILLKMLPHAVAVLVFVIAAQLFFSLENDEYSLRQSDIHHVMGMAKELADYRMMNDGEEALWSNNMFGGMPGYQTNVLYPSNVLRMIDEVIKLGQDPATGTLFMCMLGFYIFCLCVRINPWLGIAAGLAFGLSTINVLYLGGGHTSKVNAIAYMAPTLGAMLLALRGRLLLGAGLFALFFGLHIAASHLQMTYYLAFLLGAVGLGELIKLLIEKKWTYAIKSVGSLVAALLIGAAPNMGSLLTTYEYSKLTTRGKTELTITPPKEEGVTPTSEGDGLSPDYILQYNMAGREWMAVFLPNAKGGNTSAIENDKQVLAKVPSKVRKQVGSMNRYWGEQEYSGGAIYFGAFVFFLFVLALIFGKDHLRWPFLVLTLLVIGLSAKELTGLNKFFIYDFPYFNKFRDHKMMLVLLQIMAPALAFIFIDGLLKTTITNNVRKYLLIGTAALLVIGIVVCLMPSSTGSILSNADINMFEQYEQEYADSPQALEQIDQMQTALINVRKHIYTSDGQRSLMLMVVGAALVAGLAFGKLKWYMVAPAAAVIIMADMWSVSSRYMNEEKKEGQYKYYEKNADKYFPYEPDKCDIAILEKEKVNVPDFNSKADALKEKYLSTEPYKKIKDKDKIETAAQFGALALNSNYRVLLASQGAFADATVPYFHKSIGGYHAAKLKRFQEVKEFYIDKELKAFTEAMQTRDPQAVDSVTHTMKVLNMLNTRYIKFSPQAPPMANKKAMGNAWFVAEVKIANTADEEMEGIRTLDIGNAAIVHKDFLSIVKSADLDMTDSTAKVTLDKYSTNYLKYTATTPTDAPLIFSEVYYPEGWKCSIDGNEVPAFRANYLLRGVMVPAGMHTVEWEFSPASYIKGVTINKIGSALLLLLVLGALGWSVRDYFKTKVDMA
ncbi:MAG: YfhO family protein [Flavobacteriales bacterium]